MINVSRTGQHALHNLWGVGCKSPGQLYLHLGNYVDNPDGYADMYIATEADWNTQDVNNVTVSRNAFLEGGPNQGAVLYNTQGTTAPRWRRFSGGQRQRDRNYPGERH
jgi:hypothetical protein